MSEKLPFLRLEAPEKSRTYHYADHSRTILNLWSRSRCCDAPTDRTPAFSLSDPGVDCPN